MELPVLDPMEQRILGCLLEKQVTVPGSYPLSLNGLRTACNQTSSRDPVVDWAEPEIETCVRGLKAKELVRVVWTSGSRALKYHQLLEENLSLAADEKALVTVLLLRGPQAPGELRTRTERLHGFADRDAVEACLWGLAERGLVQQLPLRPREQDRRWVHLLGPVDGATAPPADDIDRDVVLAHGSGARDQAVVDTYSLVAGDYADAFAGELDAKPFDRWLLSRVATEAVGPVADVGSGPGHITAFLADEGAEVRGYDVSPAMVAEARTRFSDVAFEVADLRRLLRPPAASAWGAITAWYAFVHLAESELAPALTHLAGTLAPDGLLAFAVHSGPETRHFDEWFGHDVDLDFVLHDPDAALAAARAAGLDVVEWYLRGPVAGEVETNRLYVLARKR